jgi:hypothetical protein
VFLGVEIYSFKSLVWAYIIHFFIFARVVFSETLNETVQLHVCCLIIYCKSYLCWTGKTRNVSDTDLTFCLLEF